MSVLTIDYKEIQEGTGRIIIWDDLKYFVAREDSKIKLYPIVEETAK